MKTLRHYFPALVAVALLGRPAFAADPPPDVTLPPSEQPKAFVAFAKSQADDTVDWTLKDANVPAAWAKGVTGKGFVVGVIDTGTDTRHPDLAGQEIGGTDFSGKGSTIDGNGHGTWCASHIVGKKDGKGIVGGAYNAKLRTYKALSDQGSGYNSAIARAIDHAAADGCHVLSLSLGSPQPDPLTLAALKRAIDRGCIIACIAAGNEGPREGTVGYPGGFAAGELPLVVCVAAHDRGGATAAFSSRGKAVTITLGGVDALAAWVGGQYAAIDGTSMATPLAAVLALLWLEGGGGDLPAKDRPAAFLAALVRSCDQYPKRDTARGYGKPDAVKLLATIPSRRSPRSPASGPSRSTPRSCGRAASSGSSSSSTGRPRPHRSRRPRCHCRRPPRSATRSPACGCRRPRRGTCPRRRRCHRRCRRPARRAGARRTHNR